MAEFDVIVIGAGPAGEVAAGRTANGGLRTAIVERELIGGECSYWGCIPSKTLLRPGDVIAAARRVPGAAQAVTGPIDVEKALVRRDYMTSSWDDAGQVPWLDDNAIALFRGTGRLAGPRTVEVTASDGTVTTLTATKGVILATGTRAFLPPIPGLSEVAAWTNREVTALKQVPARLIVLGGGAVGVEMAQAVKRLGAAEVTVVEGADRVLTREEPFAGEQVAAAFAAEGITVLTGTRVSAVRREADGSVSATLDNGGVLSGDELLVAVGRRPSTGDLGLDSVGLTPGKPVDVDERLLATGLDQAGDEWLYAIGDCNGVALLTHMGKYQARVAGDVLLGKPAIDRASHDIVPRVTFTDPQVCAVGLTEAQARERGVDVKVLSVSTGSVPGAYTRGEGIDGTCQLVIDAGSELIVGATFTGPDLAELLHSATVAIAGKVPMPTLAHAVASFPTLSEVWLKLIESYGL